MKIKVLICCYIFLSCCTMARAMELNFIWNYDTSTKDLAGYRIYMDGNRIWESENKINTAAQVNIPDEEIIRYFTATAFDVYGNESDHSSPRCYVNFSLTSPPNPTILDNSLIWSEVEGDIAGYTITWGVAQGSGESIDLGPLNEFDISTLGLENGTYWFKINAYDSNGYPGKVTNRIEISILSGDIQTFRIIESTGGYKLFLRKRNRR